MIPIDTFLSTSYSILNLGVVILATIITTRTCNKHKDLKTLHANDTQYTQQVIRTHRILQIIAGVFIFGIGVYNICIRVSRPHTCSNRFLQSTIQIATGLSLLTLVILTFIIPEWLNGWVCQPLQNILIDPYNK